MPPLSAADCKTHQKARERLQEEQNEKVVAENRLQYRENDPLPLDEWVPSILTEEGGEIKY